MSKLINYLVILISVILRTFYFLFSLSLIFALAFLFGYKILHIPLAGNDAAHALSYATWLDRYFPNLPFWYPVQGAGISIVYGYPIAFHLTAVVLHKLYPVWTLIQTFGVINFSTLILTSIGIYFFVWTRFKNQTMALIASFFYFLSPMTYVWIIGAGFLAQTFSFIFITPALLFFDLYLDDSLNDVRTLSRRIYFALAAIFVALAMFSHPATGLGIIMIETTYGLLYPFLKSKKGERLKNLKAGFLVTLKVNIIVLFLILFWGLPFYQYSQLANRGIYPGPTADTSILTNFTIKGTLGLEKEGYFYTNFSIVPAVWILAFIGIAFSFFYNKKILSLGIISLTAFYLTSSFQVYNFLYQFIGTFAQNFHFRWYTGYTIILFPIMASFGVWAVSQTIFLPLKLFNERILKAGFLNRVILNINYFLVATLSIAITGAAVYLLKNIYNSDKSTFYYGPERGGYSQRIGKSIYNIWDIDECQEGTRDQNKCPFLPKPTLAEQLQPKNWPAFKIGDLPDGAAQSVYSNEGIKGQIPKIPLARADITPNLGAQTKNWPIYITDSIINTYTFQLSLIHPMWGYEQGIFYSRDPLYQNPILVNEAGKYFGVDYLVLNPVSDPIEKFQAAGWKVYSQGKGGYGFEVWQPDKPTGIYSLIGQPKVLVIGKLRYGAFEGVFRLANLGVIPYDDAFLVEGESSKIDDYSDKELKNFDLIILHGYDYKNKNKAWSRLERYVAGGGSLFIDTGWQFIDKDWGKGPDREGRFYSVELPEPSPVKRTSWSNIGTSWNGTEFDKDIEIDTTKLDPPLYTDKPWSMAVAQQEDLRENTIPLIKKGDKVVMAMRNYGQGKVIWSGMNLIAFTMEKKGGETLKFTKQIVGQLYRPQTASEEINDAKVFVERPNPDKVEFTFKEDMDSKIGLFWRESYYPGWKAELINGGRKEIKIYRAGPGFMFLPLKDIEAGSKLILEYKTLPSSYFARIVSLITFSGLIVYIFYPRLLFKLGSSLKKVVRFNLKKNLGLEEMEE